MTLLKKAMSFKNDEERQAWLSSLGDDESIALVKELESVIKPLTGTMIELARTFMDAVRPIAEQVRRWANSMNDVMSYIIESVNTSDTLLSKGWITDGKLWVDPTSKRRYVISHALMIQNEYDYADRLKKEEEQLQGFLSFDIDDEKTFNAIFPPKQKERINAKKQAKGRLGTKGAGHREHTKKERSTKRQAREQRGKADKYIRPARGLHKSTTGKPGKGRK